MAAEADMKGELEAIGCKGATCPILKQELGKRGLRVSGNKSTLQRRLVDFERLRRVNGAVEPIAAEGGGGNPQVDASFRAQLRERAKRLRIQQKWLQQQMQVPPLVGAENNDDMMEEDDDYVANVAFGRERRDYIEISSSDEEKDKDGEEKEEVRVQDEAQSLRLRIRSACAELGKCAFGRVRELSIKAGLENIATTPKPELCQRLAVRYQLDRFMDEEDAIGVDELNPDLVDIKTFEPMIVRPVLASDGYHYEEETWRQLRAAPGGGLSPFEPRAPLTDTHIFDRKFKDLVVQELQELGLWTAEFAGMAAAPPPQNFM